MKRCCENIDDLEEEKITDILHKLGIPSHYKGFLYIKDIIHLLLNNERTTIKLKDDIYKTVAKKYKTRGSNVERNIRYAIEVGCGRANYSYQDRVFSNSINPLSYKQSNKEFLITVTDRVRLEMNNELD